MIFILCIIFGCASYFLQKYVVTAGTALVVGIVGKFHIKKSLAVSLTCIQQNNIESLQSYFISIFQNFICKKSKSLGT